MGLTAGGRGGAGGAGLLHATIIVDEISAAQDEKRMDGGRPIPYLAFGGISFDGQCANVHLSLTLMPPKRGASAECCTGVVDTFAKDGTTWSLIERGQTIIY